MQAQCAVGFQENCSEPARVKLPVAGGGGLALVASSGFALPRFNGGPWNIDNPSTGADQLVVIVGVTDSGEFGNYFDTAPAGFAFGSDHPNTGAYNYPGRRYAWKITDGTEGSTFSVDASSTGGDVTFLAAAFSGVDTANPFAEERLPANGYSGTATLAAPAAGDLFVAFMAAQTTVGNVTGEDADIVRSVDHAEAMYQGLAVTSSVRSFEWTFGSSVEWGFVGLSLNGA